MLLFSKSKLTTAESGVGCCMTTLDTFKFIIDSSVTKARELETAEEIHQLWFNIWEILSTFVFYERQYDQSEPGELENLVEIAKIRANAHLL